MEKTCRVVLKIRVLVLAVHLSVAALSFTHSDARRSMHIVGEGGARHPARVRVRERERERGSSLINKATNEIQVSKHLEFDIGPQLDASNTVPYGVSSPFSLPPYDSLPPVPLPDYAPPFCVYPPFTPQPPSTTIPTFPPPPTTAGGGGGGGPTPTPTPSFPLPPPSSSTPFQSPPPGPAAGGGGGIIPTPPQSIPSPNGPNPPEIVPRPPSPPTIVPGPTVPVLSPPYNFQPSPPFNNNGPPSPSIFVPTPPVFQPPVVFPPPAVPPPPKKAPFSALWCVAKPTVPDPIIQEAMNYACGSGANCDSVLPNGSCFQPDTLLSHASYAFNSFWQRTKVAGGTCDFGGTAILVTVDPTMTGATLNTTKSIYNITEE
ncbi:unnamed protein product [Camellia sinensis]